MIHSFINSFISVLNLLSQFQDTASAAGEFDGTSQVVVFSTAASDVQQVAFIASDDTVPEADESFTLTATIYSGNAAVVEPSRAVITIPANDDAFGIVGFDTVSRHVSSLVPKETKVPGIGTLMECITMLVAVGTYLISNKK